MEVTFRLLFSWLVRIFTYIELAKYSIKRPQLILFSVFLRNYSLETSCVLGRWSIFSQLQVLRQNARLLASAVFWTNMQLATLFNDSARVKLKKVSSGIIVVENAHVWHATLLTCPRILTPGNLFLLLENLSVHYIWLQNLFVHCAVVLMLISIVLIFPFLTWDKRCFKEISCFKKCALELALPWNAKKIKPVKNCYIS